jgi:hypothetical protein
MKKEQTQTQNIITNLGTFTLTENNTYCCEQLKATLKIENNNYTYKEKDTTYFNLEITNPKKVLITPSKNKMGYSCCLKT